MDAKIFLLLVLCAVVVNCAQDDGDKFLEAGNTRCKVAGRSGKIMCHKNLKGECDAGETTEMPPHDDTSDQPDENKDDEKKDDKEDCKATVPIQISVDSIAELDADNATVKSVAFHGSDFDFGLVMKDVVIPNTNDVKSTHLATRATEDTMVLSVTLYVATGDGKLTLDDEVSDVKTDQMKFTLGVTSWVFAADANKLEVKLEIKSRDAPKLKEGSDLVVLELGGGAEMTLSRKVQYDGSWASMEAGYPKLESGNGNKHYMILRFAKFGVNVLYDPTAELGDWAEGDNGPISGAVTSYVTSSLACLLTIVTAMFV